MSELFSQMQEILAPNNYIVYEIPEFQREYAWGKEQWNTLFDDITENEEGYFVGSIICIVGKAMKQNEPIQYQIIDGQQRLMTISILLLALLSDLDINEEKEEFDVLSQEMQNLAKAHLMIRYDSKKKDAYRLIPLEANAKDYYYLIHSTLDRECDDCVNSKPDYYGNRRISLAYEFFKRKLSNLEKSEKYELLSKVLKTLVVSINVEDETKAYILFETLNNRGLPLSIMDLIKNNLIKVSAIEGKKEQCSENWKIMARNIGDDSKTQERFLRHFYNALKRDNITNDNAQKAKRSNLLDLYKDGIEKDCVHFTKQLREASQMYARITTSTKDAIDKNYYNDLLDLKHAEGTTSYTLLLYLLENKERLNISDNTLSRIISTLVNFFLIRSLMERPATRELDDMFMEIIDNIKKLSNCEDIYEQIVYILKKHQDVAKDDISRELEKDVYTEYFGVTRFFLAYFETNSDGEKGKDYDKYWTRNDKGHLVWTIEHILPETNNKLPDGWTQMLSSNKECPSDDEAKKIQNDKMHKLGNLTLTPYNSELSNSTLYEKQNANKEKGGYKTTNLYINGNMNSDEVVAVKDAEKWTAEEIDKRTKFLVSKFVEKVYPIDNTNDIYKNQL